MSTKISNSLVEVCALLIAILVPLLINPFTTAPLEAAKGVLFEGLTLIMLAGWFLARPKMERRPASNDSVLSVIRSRLWIERPYFIPALTYLVICAIAALLSADPEQSFLGARTYQGMLFISALVVFYLVVAETMHSAEQIERIITALIVGSVPVAIYGCIQFYSLDPLIWKTASISPVHSTVGYSLYLGAYLAMVIPFTMSRLLAAGGRGRHNSNYPYAIILILQCACLLFTLSRGALAAAIVGGIVFCGLLIHRQPRWIHAAAIVFIVLVGGVFFLALNFGWQIAPVSKEAAIPRSDLLQNRQSSNLDRLTIWRGTIPMIMERPLFGYGPDTFAMVYARHNSTLSDGLAPSTTSWDAHNLVLAQMISGGIPSLLVLCWVIFNFYHRAYGLFRNANQTSIRLISAALLASATVYLVQAQFNPSGLVATVIFWLVLGIGSGRISQSIMQKNSP